MSNLSGIFGNSENNEDSGIITSNSEKPNTGLFTSRNTKLETFTKPFEERTPTEISKENNEE